jgi:hypothetical protein
MRSQELPKLVPVIRAVILGKYYCQFNKLLDRRPKSISYTSLHPRSNAGRLGVGEARGLWEGRRQKRHQNHDQDTRQVDEGRLR